MTVINLRIPLTKMPVEEIYREVAQNKAIINFKEFKYDFKEIILDDNFKKEDSNMEKLKNVLNGTLEEYNDVVVPKIPVFAGNDITSEVYYFKPNQVLNAHKHPNGEQIFIILRGKGKMLLGDDSVDLCEGSMIFVEANQWHEIINSTESDMVAVQITKVGAGFESRGH